MTIETKPQYQQLARNIRLTVLEMVFRKKASHVGGAFSIADILAYLYTGFLNIEPSTVDSPNRDRLFYSKGHACTAMYATLYRKGFFSKDLLDSFTDNGSEMTSHTNHKIPGVEFSAGSLGHLLPVATGVALAGKLKKLPFRTVCILSDGELNEGSNWEAILFAGHHNLKNLTAFVDYNKIQSFGFTKDVLNLEPLAEKFRAFGWDVVEVDGHNFAEIDRALQATRPSEKPFAVVAHTIKGKGVSFMENELKWHYKSPSEDEYVAAVKELNS